MSRTDRTVTRGHKMEQALATWSVDRHEINGPEHDLERDEILADLYAFTHYAISGPDVLVKGRNGVALVSPHPTEMSLVVFTYRRRGERQLRTFWMNRSSVDELSRTIAASSGDHVVDFAALLLGEVV